MMAEDHRPHREKGHRPCPQVLPSTFNPETLGCQTELLLSNEPEDTMIAIASGSTSAASCVSIKHVLWRVLKAEININGFADEKKNYLLQ